MSVQAEEDGIFLVHKPLGKTPLQVLEEFKAAREIEGKMSFAGRLDPMAQGLLVCLAGDRCLRQKDFEHMDKVYRFWVVVGVQTDTHDLMGLPKGAPRFSDETDLGEAEIRRRVAAWCGRFSQQYPKFSSARVNGKACFYWAARGVDFEPPFHDVEVFDARVLEVGAISQSELCELACRRVRLVTRGKFRQEEICRAWEDLRQQPQPSRKFLKVQVEAKNKDGQNGLVEGVEEAAKDAWLLTKLALILFSFFKIGVVWYLRTLQLMLFVLLLIVPFLRGLWWYLTSPLVLRGVRYGPKSRNKLDIYLPPDMLSGGLARRRRVVIMVSGGAWIIGYRAWAMFFAPWFMRRGVLLVAPDYRNFPQGTVSQMLSDVDRSVAWTLAHIGDFGGDPAQVVLWGQSAGAHLALQAYLEQLEHALEKDMRGAKKDAMDHDGMGDNISSTPAPARRLRRTLGLWAPERVGVVVGLSGPYDLQTMKEHFDQRGLYASITSNIMEGELSGHSPTRRLRQMRAAHGAEALRKRVGSTEIVLLHGGADRTVPPRSSRDLAEEARRCLLRVREETFAGKSHTDAIVEDNFGGENPIMEALMGYLRLGEDEEVGEEKEGGDDVRRWTVPTFSASTPRMLQAARAINPF